MPECQVCGVDSLQKEAGSKKHNKEVTVGHDPQVGTYCFTK